jgi:hypothetical protein
MRRLLHIGSRCLLLRPLHLEARALCLKVRSLYLEQRAWHLHWHLQSVHVWWLEELVRLREVKPNVASGGLSMEWHLPLAILLHLLDLVFNNNGLVDHVLEVYVIRVEQLELNIIIQEHVTFLFITADVVRGTS